jgi:glutamyl-tRNA reductase
MNILAIGLNHKTADVEIREKIAFNNKKFEEGILGIKSLPEINEVIILSTCNRVEIYAVVKDLKQAQTAIKDFIAGFHGVEKNTLASALFIYENLDAVRHIFRVASSLDSMIIGEPQIIGQIKNAFELALSKKTTGIMLNKLFKKALSVTKRVRTETKIAENAVSIGFAAVELAKKIFKDLSTKSVMLLGAGEMAELAARHLINSGVKDIVFSNRTHEKGCAIAEGLKCRTVRFESFVQELLNTDIVICSTGASSYILSKNQMQKTMKERKNEPMFIIDISVPRNIDPEINTLGNVYLYDIDDLQGTINTNKLERQKEAQKAEAIINEETEKFHEWHLSLDSVPTIIALREKADAIKKEEIEKTLNKFPDMNLKEKEAIECLATQIINKLIHPPTVALKEEIEDREELIAVIKKLYGLE